MQELFMISPKRFRRHAGLAVEDTAEVTAIRKPDQTGDLGNGSLPGLEQFPGAVDTIPLEIFDGRGAKLLPEAEGQIIFGDVDMTSNIPPRYGSGVMFMDVRHRLTD